jgi:hypothetical protein
LKFFKKSRDGDTHILTTTGTPRNGVQGGINISLYADILMELAEARALGVRLGRWQRPAIIASPLPAHTPYVYASALCASTHHRRTLCRA